MTAPAYRTREAIAPDLGSLVGLLRLLFQLESDFETDPDRQAAGLRLLLEQPQRGRIFVALLDGRPVGMCSVQTTLSTAEGGEAALVEDVVVHPEHRGRGLGARLLGEVEAWCAGRGIRRLQLLMDRDNGPAEAFYRRTGWQATRLVALRKRLASQ